MVPGARLVVLGKQGAGKGTQCVRLSHHYVVPHVSTGDMLRAAVKQDTPIGQKAKDLMDRGELLGDDLIMDMVAERLGESDVRAIAVIEHELVRTPRNDRAAGGARCAAEDDQLIRPGQRLCVHGGKRHREDDHEAQKPHHGAPHMVVTIDVISR